MKMATKIPQPKPEPFCPYCGSDEVTSSGRLTHGTPTSTEPYRCALCHTTWDCLWERVGIADVVIKGVPNA